MGNESSINFWYDKWSVDEHFIIMYPKLFLNSDQKRKVLKNMEKQN